MDKTDKTFANKTQLNRAMRSMIKHVICGDPALPQEPTRVDYEVMAECVSRGYLYQIPRKKGTTVGRDIHGVPCCIIDTSAVPEEGLAFLNPKGGESLRSTLALIISVLALLVSFLGNYSSICLSIKQIFSR